MKTKFTTVLCLLIAAIATTTQSCKKDGAGPGGAIENSLVKDMVITYTNSLDNAHFDYDDQQRDKSWAYSELKIEKSFGGPQYTSSMQIDAQGRVTQVDTKGLNGVGNDYRLLYSYDDQGRVKSILTKSKFTTTNYRDESQTDFIYDADNNLSKIKRGYMQYNYYTVTTFSDFKAEFKNSLSTKNFGFNHFGTASYPSFFMDAGGSGHSGATFYMFGGNLMPGKYTTRDYLKSDDSPKTVEQTLYTYNYQKDSNGRITRIEANYFQGQKETYAISYY
ncbi:hypothetical protein ACVW0P_002300 [Mucilaginibacter sp. UYNi724]